MMPDCFLTIAIPVYNRRELVRRTLDSVAAQTYRPLKVILVDNASTDNTIDTLNEWADNVSDTDFEVEVIVENTPGAPAARNAALARTVTPWLMFFDSDDTMAPEHVHNIKRMIDNFDVDVVGWSVRIHFLDGTSVVKPFAIKDMLYNSIMHGTFATQRYTARTEIFRMVGGWREDVAVWNDIELGSRILGQGQGLRVACIRGVPEVDVYQTEQSITGLNFHDNGDKREYALRCIYHILAPQFKYIVPIKMTILAACYAREGYEADALRLRDEALTLTAHGYNRWLLRLAFLYTRIGGRGVARILSKLFKR